MRSRSGVDMEWRWNVSLHSTWRIQERLKPLNAEGGHIIRWQFFHITFREQIMTPSSITPFRSTYFITCLHTPNAAGELSVLLTAQVPGLNLRSGSSYFWLRLLVAFLSAAKQIPWEYLKLTEDPILPHVYNSSFFNNSTILHCMTGRANIIGQ
jgi:hypothetical protein